MNESGPSKKTIILVSILCLSILAIAYFMLFSGGGNEKLAQRGDVLAQPKSATVRLTPLGFEPATLTIEKDTVVTFTNKSNNSYWIASATSSALNGFGSGVIAPGQSYSFVYTEIGEWSYVEQTNGKFKGTIQVID